VDYYKRALELAPDDENLWYNLARAQYERQDWPKCVEAVARCLDLDPLHLEGRKMMEYITKKGLV
jgi:tetratricopeptide (TPR) repeat protein